MTEAGRAFAGIGLGPVRLARLALNGERSVPVSCETVFDNILSSGGEPTIYCEDEVVNEPSGNVIGVFTGNTPGAGRFGTGSFVEKSGRGGKSLLELA